MATVTTPAGDVLEGVTGDLLEYYRNEGYTVVEDEEAPESQFPQVHGDVTVEEVADPAAGGDAPPAGNPVVDEPDASEPGLPRRDRR